MAAQGQKRRDVWMNQERHYCSYCNAWMGSDRQSILIHENGKKHRENVETKLKGKRKEKQEEEKKNKALLGILKQVEESAATSHASDIGVYQHRIAPTPQVSSFPTQEERGSARDEKATWEAKKKSREDKKKKKDEQQDEEQKKVVEKKRTIAPDEGHYTIDGKTYLECPTFGALLEEDMPVQIWTGFRDASRAEVRLLEKQHLWKNGLVVKTRASREGESEQSVLVDVAYLLQPSDTDETLEKSVKSERLRIILGADDSIPDTLEEARLTAMGGEVVEKIDHERTADVDENTGLSSWGTVSVKRTTVHQERKEERDRARKKRRAEIDRVENLKKEADARRMEEAKVENADDSALGAYDVWSSGKGGYKGVEIHKETKLTVQDTAKSLSKGKGNVGFKKRSGSSLFKKSKKKQNRRTTSADDD